MLPPSPQDTVPPPALEHCFVRYSSAEQTRSEGSPQWPCRRAGAGERCEHAAASRAAAEDGPAAVPCRGATHAAESPPRVTGEAKR